IRDPPYSLVGSEMCIRDSTTGDELSDLADHFNKMWEKLNHTILNVMNTSESVSYTHLTLPTTKALC
ncbi:hypothetical protein, partial [Bacillus pumilus]|uniref:hypothetical protein n=1 Tax=Bacillus pumilus TaxID=1408 RepID=UPI001C97D780